MYDEEIKEDPLDIAGFSRTPKYLHPVANLNIYFGIVGYDNSMGVLAVAASTPADSRDIAGGGDCHGNDSRVHYTTTL